MAMQSFIYPLLIGVNEFGKAMLFLSPIYFSQALVEPVLQAKFNRDSLNNGLDLFLVMFVSFFAAVIFFIIALIINAPIIQVFLFFLTYLVYTILYSFLLMKHGMKSVANSSSIVTLAYFIILATTYQHGFKSVLYANCTSFLIGSLYLMSVFREKKDGFLLEFSCKSLNVSFLLSSMLMRLPHVFMVNGFIILMGAVGYSVKDIGQFKIFTSVVNAGRYFNIVPIQKIQVSISNYVYFGAIHRKDLIKDLYLFCSCIAVFSLLTTLMITDFFILFYSPIDISFYYTILCCTALLIQPLSYGLLCVFDKNNKNPSIFYLLLSLLMAFVTYLLLEMQYTIFEIYSWLAVITLSVSYLSIYIIRKE